MFYTQLIQELVDLVARIEVNNGDPVEIYHSELVALKQLLESVRVLGGLSV